MISSRLQNRYDLLRDTLKSLGAVAVAFSGGVDSTFLLHAAHNALPGRVKAFFADSQVQPAGERESTVILAQEIGVPLQVLEFDLLADPEFIANPPDRCYLCKSRIFTAILESSRQQGMVLADGTNIDDLRQTRPGMRACRELGVKSPLLEAGLSKQDIRLLSRELGLPTWDKPSASCLATRIAAGDKITADNLALVARGEDYLHSLGLMGCRLRLKGDKATIELAAGDLGRVSERGQLPEIAEFLHSLGLKKVLLDLSEREGILS